MPEKNPHKKQEIAHIIYVFFALDPRNRQHNLCFFHETTERDNTIMLLSLDPRNSQHNLCFFQYTPEIADTVYVSFIRRQK